MLPSESSITYDDEMQQLRDQGFDERQIKFLQDSRTLYTQSVIFDNPAEQRRLEFARWLFEHGKIMN